MTKGRQHVGESRRHRITEERHIQRQTQHGGQELVALGDGELAAHRFWALEKEFVVTGEGVEQFAPGC